MWKNFRITLENNIGISQISLTQHLTQLNLTPCLTQDFFVQIGNFFEVIKGRGKGSILGITQA